MKRIFSILFAVVLVVSFSLIPAALVGASPGPGLVGEWHFDGDANDSSGNGNDGTISGASWTTSGKLGQALSFDGTDDYVEVPHSTSLDITSQITVEGWIKLSSFAQQSTVAGKWRDIGGANLRGYLLTVGADGKPRFYISTNGSNHPVAMGTAALSLDTWYHLAGTYDGADIKLYVNGALVTTNAQTGSIFSNTEPLLIGANDGWGGSLRKFTNGTIDEVRIWDTAHPPLHVDDNGAQYATPYTTIQGAVNAATTGDTIIVHEGTYTEQINIDKSITITGAGQNSTHIVSPAPTTMTIYDLFGSKAGSNVRYIGHRGVNIPVVRIAASTVTFEGFHVDLDNQVFWDVLGTGSDSTYSKGVGILVDHVETTAGTPDLFTGITIQNNKIDGLLWNDYGDGIKVLAQATVNINHNTIYGYGESAVSAQGVDSPTRAAFYPTVTANSNTLYGGTNARPGNHYFFGIGYWSGAAGSADGNTIYNAPNNNGYALNSWTPNPVSFTNNIIRTDGVAVGGYGAQLYESSNLIFSGNDVQDQGLAGAIWSNPTITITNNNISNCIDGFIGDGLTTAGSVTLHYNSFEGTASGHYALDMAGHGVSIWGSAGSCTITANATMNWWGDCSGPYHPTTNSLGLGDAVSDYVDYDPWLGKELCALKVDIAGLSDSDFTKPNAASGPDGQKQALLDKIDDVCGQYGAGAYRGALNKLQRDIEKRINKWIVTDEQAALLAYIDAEIAILQGFLP